MELTKQKYSELFTELRNILIEKKLIGFDWKYGIMMLVLSSSFYLLGLFLMPIIGPALIVLYFSLVFVEFGYISHDLLHNQYFSNLKLNHFLVSIFANLGIGLSWSWWVKKHNFSHHNNTNSDIYDVDIRDYDEIFTKNPGKVPFFHRYKSLLFWGAILFVYFALLYRSFRYIFTEKKWGELLLSTLFLCFFPGLLVFHFGVFVGLIAFFVIGLIVGTILALVFMVNHIGMEVIHGEIVKELSWMDLQTRTSRNITGSRFITEIFGGLDKQIEHHLFPQVSRRKIRRVAKEVKEFCKKNNLPYHEVTFREALSEIYHTLKSGETITFEKSL